jgi:NADPH2:quinone reductase
MVGGKYQTRPSFPFCPGNVVTGTVDECGAGVNEFSIGDRVLAVLPYGGYAEQAVAGEETVVSVPDSVSFADAAALGMGHATAYLGLVDRGSLAAGEVLLVRGAGGGLGHAAVELGQRLGAVVIATGSSSAKLEVAAESGALHLINPLIDDLRTRVLDITAGRGVDVIFDPVGSDFTQSCLRTIGWRGRILVVGFAGGEIPAIPSQYVLNKFCSIIGVSWGNYFCQREPGRFRSILQQILEMCAAGCFRRPAARIVPYHEAVSVLREIALRSSMGRSVMSFRD